MEEMGKKWKLLEFRIFVFGVRTPVSSLCRKSAKYASVCVRVCVCVCVCLLT